MASVRETFWWNIRMHYWTNELKLWSNFIFRIIANGLRYAQFVFYLHENNAEIIVRKDKVL